MRDSKTVVCPYDRKITRERRAEIADELAEAHASVQSLEADFATLKDQHKGNVGRHEAITNRLTTDLRRGFETVDVACAVEYDLDTNKAAYAAIEGQPIPAGELVKERALTSEERERLAQMPLPGSH